MVGFTKTGDRLVGQVAKRQAITNPERTVASIKREMGTDYKVNIDGKAYTPQEISAMILGKLKADVYKRQVYRIPGVGTRKGVRCRGAWRQRSKAAGAAGT